MFQTCLTCPGTQHGDDHVAKFPLLYVRRLGSKLATSTFHGLKTKFWLHTNDARMTLVRQVQESFLKR